MRSKIDVLSQLFVARQCMRLTTVEASQGMRLTTVEASQGMRLTTA